MYLVKMRLKTCFLDKNWRRYSCFIICTYCFHLAFPIVIGFYCWGTGYVVGIGSSQTFRPKQAQKHVFWIGTEEDTAILSSAHIVSTWHFQLYTWVSSYFTNYSWNSGQWLMIAHFVASARHIVSVRGHFYQPTSLTEYLHPTTLDTFHLCNVLYVPPHRQ